MQIFKVSRIQRNKRQACVVGCAEGAGARPSHQGLQLQELALPEEVLRVLLGADAVLLHVPVNAPSPAADVHACLSPAHRRQLLRNSRMISMRRSCLATQMQQLAYHVTAAGLHGVCLSGARGIQSRQAAGISSIFGSLACAEHSCMLSVPLWLHRCIGCANQAPGAVQSERPQKVAKRATGGIPTNVPAGRSVSAPAQQPQVFPTERFPLPDAYNLRPSSKAKEGTPFLQITK